jgi:hypothetical protein
MNRSGRRVVTWSLTETDPLVLPGQFAAMPRKRVSKTDAKGFTDLG